jgi:molecular chaperone DnaK
MSAAEVVVGIDLGTTNSSIGYMDAGTPRLIAIEGSVLLPSAVGVAPDGALLVGAAARNQRLVFPERTVTSIKRRMGESARLRLGETEYSPVEISAFILRRLKAAAEAHLKRPVRRAVITVPAFFSDAQRTATREAGEMAGFQVERILNEPTAAALCYVDATGPARTLLVYDLGGGTFDVSIVRTQGEITEVLASHGDTHLGGDDFDRLLADALHRRFTEAHGVSPKDDARAMARLSRAAEAAKIALSGRVHQPVSEEHLMERDGLPLHLDTEVGRPEYEGMIEALLRRTVDSVQFALREANVLARDLDDVILVGGSTRTPAVGRLLHDLLGKAPRCEVNPDEAVALGATLQAARLAGLSTARILVDVTPYSFGTSYYGVLNGRESDDCYQVIVRRNTPLPARQAEVFYTLYAGQDATEVRVYQGEAPDARDNLFLGGFMMEGLDTDADEDSELVFELAVDLNGILHVEVTEKHTGLRREITLENAFRTLDAAEMSAARQRISDAFGDSEDAVVFEAPQARSLPAAPAGLPESERGAWATAVSLVEKADRLLPDLAPTDRAEVEDAIAEIVGALTAGASSDVRTHSAALADILFYLE